MNPDDKENRLRRYAAGEITWQPLRELGFDNDLDVLGDPGLRPPVTPMEGPNVEIRQTTRALIRKALARQRVTSWRRFAWTIITNARAPPQRDDGSWTSDRRTLGRSH